TGALRLAVFRSEHGIGYLRRHHHELPLDPDRCEREHRERWWDLGSGFRRRPARLRRVAHSPRRIVLGLYFLGRGSAPGLVLSKIVAISCIDDWAALPGETPSRSRPLRGGSVPE